MKRFRHNIFGLKALIFAAISASILLGSCCKEPLDIPAERSLLIYMAADNDLSEFSFTNMVKLKDGFLPKNGNIIVYQDPSDALPRLFRLVKQGSEVKEELIEEYPEENSATSEVLARCLLRMSQLFPAEDYALIMWSHGTGWLPAGTQVIHKASQTLLDVDYPMVKTFGKDGLREMDLDELVSAISSFPYHLSFILFDACLMGGIEVAYALKDLADWIVAAPTEIMGTGFPYDKIMQPIFLPQPDLEAVCNEFYRFYNEQTGVSKSATIALYNTQVLSALAASVRSIFEANRDKLNDFVPTGLQYYDRLTSRPHLFYDLDHFVSQIASPLEYAAFSEILNQMIPYKLNTPSFYGSAIPLFHFGGISTYIPVTGQQSGIREAYKKTEWNKAVGLLE
ncbi:MAG: clostripain-related cysteine peptidase [Bacteroidetes bacterium]|nr:clostripain-related cysteine peptidase [Bacteroidota bacterium]